MCECLNAMDVQCPIRDKGGNPFSMFYTLVTNELVFSLREGMALCSDIYLIGSPDGDAQQFFGDILSMFRVTLPSIPYAHRRLIPADTHWCIVIQANVDPDIYKAILVLRYSSCHVWNKGVFLAPFLPRSYLRAFAHSMVGILLLLRTTKKSLFCTVEIGRPAAFIATDFPGQ